MWCIFISGSCFLRIIRTLTCSTVAKTLQLNQDKRELKSLSFPWSTLKGLPLFCSELPYFATFTSVKPTQLQCMGYKPQCWYWYSFEHDLSLCIAANPVGIPSKWQLKSLIKFTSCCAMTGPHIALLCPPEACLCSFGKNDSFGACRVSPECQPRAGCRPKSHFYRNFHRDLVKWTHIHYMPVRTWPKIHLQARPFFEF